MQIINLLVNAGLQVLLFAMIPLVWWFIFAREQKNFFIWLGFKKTMIQNKLKYLGLFLTISAILIFPSLLAVTFFIDKSTMATNQFSGQGISAVIPVLIYSFFQTGLSEELFFRGFLTKRFVHKLGFYLGNIMQGLLFGILHGILFASAIEPVGTVVIIFITAIAGYLLGWINEKQSNGSILPSWFIHGFVNTIASIIAMLNIL